MTTQAPTQEGHHPGTPLAFAMAAQGMSQRRLSHVSGVTLRTIQEAYHGRGSLSFETAVRLAKALHVPLKAISPLLAEELAGVAIN